MKKGSKEHRLITKKNKNTWELGAEENTLYTISYEYYASKMDAGSSWVDDEQIYINFINCCIEIIGQERSKSISKHFWSEN